MEGGSVGGQTSYSVSRLPLLPPTRERGQIEENREKAGNRLCGKVWIGSNKYIGEGGSK